MVPVFVALDDTDLARLTTLVRVLDGEVAGVKLGTEFCLTHGLDAVRWLLDGTRHRLFLDLKLHDIPETVARTAAAALRARPDFITLHAAGGRRMATAALEAVGRAERPPVLLGVTVLTSLDHGDLADLGGAGDPAASVRRWAGHLRAWGIGGIVCSPHEAAVLRGDPDFRDLVLVTPGIRPAWAAVPGDDQRRTLGPAEALASGADLLVIGRPITRAADPLAAVRRIRKEINSERRVA